jgi:hypothetical protein
MEYRATPTENRRLRTKLPIEGKLLVPENLSELSRQFEKKAHKSKNYYDRNCKKAKPFGVGEKVRILKDKK